MRRPESFTEATTPVLTCLRRESGVKAVKRAPVTSDTHVCRAGNASRCSFSMSMPSICAVELIAGSVLLCKCAFMNTVDERHRVSFRAEAHRLLIASETDAPLEIAVSLSDSMDVFSAVDDFRHDVPFLVDGALPKQGPSCFRCKS